MINQDELDAETRLGVNFFAAIGSAINDVGKTITNINQQIKPVTDIISQFTKTGTATVVTPAGAVNDTGKSAVTTSTDDFSKWLIPAGIGLLAIILLRRR